jgi:hypothetical protein
MNQQEVKKFFYNINRLRLSKSQKRRMLRIFQVRGSNNKNKVMSFKEFKTMLTKNNGKITKLVLGPKWNRLVFVDVDFEV